MKCRSPQKRRIPTYVYLGIEMSEWAKDALADHCVPALRLTYVYIGHETTRLFICTGGFRS